MPRLFRRKGLWVFLAAALLMFGGRTWLDISDFVQYTELTMPKSHTQTFDQGISRIHISTSAAPREKVSDVRVVFDFESQQAQATYDPRIIQIESRVENGDLYLTIGRQPAKHPVPRDAVRIVLPYSVKAMYLKNVGDIGISATPKKTLTKLHFSVSACNTDIGIHDIQASSLQMMQLCEQDQESGGPGFSLSKNTHVALLTVSMTTGRLQLNEMAKVDAAQLNLADNVQLHSPVQFLKASRFGTAPKLSASQIQ